MTCDQWSPAQSPAETINSTIDTFTMEQESLNMPYIAPKHSLGW